MFKLEQGEGTLGVDVNKLTDDNGVASAVYTNFLVPLGVPFTQAVISASTGTETVNFIITTVANLPNGSRGEATYELRKPTDRIINAKVGENIPDAIRVGRRIPLWQSDSQCWYACCEGRSERPPPFPAAVAFRSPIKPAWLSATLSLGAALGNHRLVSLSVRMCSSRSL